MKHTIDQEAREYFAMMRERNAYRDIIPELVDATRGLLEVFVESDKWGNYEDYACVQAARAVLSKALGETK